MSVWAALVSTKKKKKIFFFHYLHRHTPAFYYKPNSQLFWKNDFNLYFLAAPYPKEQQEQRMK